MIKDRIANLEKLALGSFSFHEGEGQGLDGVYGFIRVKLSPQRLDFYYSDEAKAEGYNLTMVGENGSYRLEKEDSSLPRSASSLLGEIALAKYPRSFEYNQSEYEDKNLVIPEEALIYAVKALTDYLYKEFLVVMFDYADEDPQAGEWLQGQQKKYPEIYTQMQKKHEQGVRADHAPGNVLKPG